MESKPNRRHIRPFKINWNKEEDITFTNSTKYKICNNDNNLRSDLTKIYKDKKTLNPRIILAGLRLVNFHITNPKLYKIFEGLSSEFDIKNKEFTIDEVILYVERNIKVGVEDVFDGKEIEAEDLYEVFRSTGDLNGMEDIKYMLRVINDGKDNDFDRLDLKVLNDLMK